MFLTGKLSPTWQALTALGGAFAIGMAIALSATTFRSLPAQVAAQGDSLRALAEREAEDRRVIERVDRQYNRIICLLTLPEDVRVRVEANPVLLQRECP